MAAPPSPSTDYFSGRSSTRTRPGPTVLPPQSRLAATPGSPRTPLLGRSISSQFGSPGSFRTEQEDLIIYELGARHLSAGFAGEGRPRCILRFCPGMGRRVGDYRGLQAGYKSDGQRGSKDKGWGEEYELYRTDVRQLDLGLVEDKLERAVRQIHADYLQLDTKPRKAVLAVPSLLPTPLLEVALKVLFDHYTQPPSIVILTTPILACVSAGLRNGLVVDIGWEETVVTAVGEYKEIYQRRSVRAGKVLGQEMASVLEKLVGDGHDGRDDDMRIPFRHAEDIVERMGWCRPRRATTSDADPATTTSKKKIPLPTSSSSPIEIPAETLSNPPETIFFAPSTNLTDHDDNELPLQNLAHAVLLHLPLDLRSLCLSRIILTGGVSALPGLKQRFLSELHALIRERGWDPVASYGSARAAFMTKMEKRLPSRTKPPDANSPPSTALTHSPTNPTKRSSLTSTADHNTASSMPAHARPHDDLMDPRSLQAEKNHAIGRYRTEAETKNAVRGVETLGAWAGASLVASLRIKGVHEVEREEWVKYGLRGGGGGVY
ncbi:hypothetical protein LTR78_009859 [Recurvomyces mirabilis]|uniref:Actin-like ATPase domain-containing protein n=1 Tax=Recurvomyces mirabilis TaxID=574656 RepID=A0AAE0TML5_9PEZI|nr:hypothetical protein LTR78_009859 [Recurvomyces mirabilis]KAK5153095.1 hypothetical protein LTS14_007739 [Recurvomyces mirabilis]